MAAKARKAGRSSGPPCEDCFFRKNLLCALKIEGDCATYRPDRPEGLLPPRQLQLVFRQERRPQRLTGFRDLVPIS